MVLDNEFSAFLYEQIHVSIVFNMSLTTFGYNKGIDFKVKSYLTHLVALIEFQHDAISLRKKVLKSHKTVHSC